MYNLKPFVDIMLFNLSTYSRELAILIFLKEPMNIDCSKELVFKYTIHLSIGIKILFK